MTHICVSKLTIIGSDNGLSPGRRQAIIWTNAGILLIGPLGTNFSEIYIEILTFSFKKMHMKVSSVKWQPFCLDLNVFMWLFCPCCNWISRHGGSSLCISASVPTKSFVYLFPLAGNEYEAMDIRANFSFPNIGTDLSMVTQMNVKSMA